MRDIFAINEEQEEVFQLKAIKPILYDKGNESSRQIKSKSAASAKKLC